MDRGRKKRSQPRASDVRERLLSAGEAILREEGFFDASARAVAERAGVAVGGVHYHFDSVEDLLLQAFDRSTEARLEQYRELVDSSEDLGSLAGATADAFAQDRAEGRFRMLAQMMAAATAGGTLAEAVADRTESWVTLTEHAAARFVGDEPFGVLRARDIAVGVVGLFIGLELLDEIDGERFDSSGFIDRVGRFLAMVAPVVTGGAADAP
jgi:AcrR family transcriptional regulator